MGQSSQLFADRVVTSKALSVSKALNSGQNSFLRLPFSTNVFYTFACDKYLD